MKNGVTKDTESYNKRIGGKDRDTRHGNRRNKRGVNHGGDQSEG